MGRSSLLRDCLIALAAFAILAALPFIFPSRGLTDFIVRLAAFGIFRLTGFYAAWVTVLLAAAVGLLALASPSVAALAIVIGADGKGVINVTTLAARLAQPELLGVSVASAAMEQATRSLAVALAPHRIRVNGVAFASVLSASLQSALRENGGWRDRIIDATPLGRIAEPVDVAMAVVFLASDEAQFITGSSLNVSGGREMH